MSRGGGVRTGRSRTRWLRGIRVRLMLTYLFVAISLAAVGVSVFTAVLESGLRSTADASLASRLAVLSADVRAGNIEQSDAPPRISPRRGGGVGVAAFTAVYDARGRLVEAQPAVLPATPVTPSELALRRSVSRTVGLAGAQFRLQTKAVAATGGTWLLVAAQNLNVVDSAAAEVRATLYIAVPVVLALIGLGTWLLSGAALKPVERMRADAQRLSGLDTAGRISEPDTQDVLHDLAATFNTLLDRLQDSLARQRALVADAGHELRTPLAVLKVELETAIRPTRTRDDLVDSIQHAEAEVTRLALLAEDLLLLAQANGTTPLVRPRWTDVATVVGQAVGAYSAHAADSRIDVTVDRRSALSIQAEVDPIALRRVIDNLLANAARHTPPGGRIVVLADAVADRPGVLIQVSDTGTGFPSEFLPAAFDRFSRADPSRYRVDSAGAGLGLAIVETLVRAHGGTVSAANLPTGGAQVSVTLPVQQVSIPGSPAVG